MNSIFSGTVDFTRINVFGAAIMAAAVLGVAFSHMLTERITAKNTSQTENTIKIISLIICAGGALLAILG